MCEWIDGLAGWQLAFLLGLGWLVVGTVCGFTVAYFWPDLNDDDDEGEI